MEIEEMNIEEARKKMNMSRKEVSDWLEIPYRTMCGWENGERECPAYVEKLIVEKILGGKKQMKNTSTIYWSGKSTNGLWKRKYQANSFLELFNLLMDKEVIDSYDYDVYDHAILEKYDKTEDDPEFQDENGDLDYDKVQKFIESKPDLTDEELWEVIFRQNGNAYYQTFERDNGEEREEIGMEDFDENGKYKY